VAVVRDADDDLVRPGDLAQEPDRVADGVARSPSGAVPWAIVENVPAKW
jgi:hypothetical protein